MIVRRSNFDEILGRLSTKTDLSLDTETTGLRPYHGDRYFSFIITDDEGPLYFNFQYYDGLDEDMVLRISEAMKLQERIFRCPFIKWYLQNAKFDMGILDVSGLELAGPIHCTRAIGRVEYNEHPSYSLDFLAKTIGMEKSDAVEKYIEEHHLWEWVDIPGKTKRDKKMFFDKVPFEIIQPYGEKDGSITYHLGKHQENSIQKQCEGTPPGLPTVRSVYANESRLTKTIFRMEKVGVRIDKDYCLRATRYEQDRATKASEAFKKETGADFKASPKLFAKIFESERKQWSYTPKGNPSFDNDALAKFGNHPVVKIIQELRDAKSKADFYNGFLYHSDGDGNVHPTFNPDGARHGRFSSSDPNLQNLTSEEGEENQEFIVRRAIIPRPGYIFIMPDYDQMEYRLMLDIAASLVKEETPLIKLVKSGLDVHEATAQAASSYGVPITRGEAKTSNFLTIYGGGTKKLSEGLNCSWQQAYDIRTTIFKAAPEILNFTQTAMKVAETRGFIRNWFGRRCSFPNRRFAYRAPNYIVAGGCADVVKVAMNRIDDLLMDKKSRMVLTIHDELPCEIHESELHLAKNIHEIMEQVYKSTYLPLTCGMEWSAKSLGDKTKGFPG